MLILRFNENVKRKRSLFRKNTTPYKTSGFIVNNTVFNVIELQKKRLKTNEIKMLLNKYKGFVLDTEDVEVNSFLQEYLFDCTPYMKRSFISGICNALRNENKFSLNVYDNDFKFSSEWVELSKKCKRIILNGVKNNDMVVFADYCFNELGLNVFINDLSVRDENEISFDLNLINNKSYIELNGAINCRVYPDKAYFILNDTAKKLIEYGVSDKMACAAVQVVRFQKIYILAD